MQKIPFLIIAALSLLVAPAWAANTTLAVEGTISIKPDGSTDWAWKDDLSLVGNQASGLVVHSIQFIPSAASDRLILRNGGIDAIAVFDSGPVPYADPIIKYYWPGGKKMKIVMDASDCTFDTAANVRIYIEYR